MDKSDLLWKFYQEHCTWERHHESQRAVATNIVLVIAAAVLSVATVNGSIGLTDLPLTVLVVVLGVFGAILSMKHYERFARHQALAQGYREALDSANSDAGVLEIREKVERHHAERHWLLSRHRLHWLWMLLHLVIALLGLVLGLGIVVRSL